MDEKEYTVPERYRCNCGADEYAERQYDGHGIYLCKTCPKCHKDKMKGFRQDIHEHYDADEQIDAEASCLAYDELD